MKRTWNPNTKTQEFSLRDPDGYYVTISAGDLNFSETVAKAESEAAGKAMEKLAEAVVAYLKDSK